MDMNDLDERFEEAARMVVANQRGSTSDLQRRLAWVMLKPVESWTSSKLPA